MFRVGLDGPGVEIREPVEIRAIPVAVSADACILSGEVRSLGKPEKAGLILLEARVGRPTVSSECC